MMDAPSSTWFTAPPGWHWLIVFYFFLGGLAGGSYFLAATMDLFARPQNRRLSRIGYYVAFPCVVVSGILLTVDLGRPDRFWHMLIENHTMGPMFKWWSPMSVGSWALAIFGVFTFLAFVAALAEDDDIFWPFLRHLQPTARQFRRFTRPLASPAVTGRVLPVIGGAFGIFIAGYTGVLLGVTNRPVWSDSPLVGMLFIVSAESTSAAVILLLAQLAGWRTSAMDAMHRLDTWVIALEFVVLVAFLVSLGPAIQAWFSVWGLLLLVGAVGIGMVLPLGMWMSPRWLGERGITTPAALVLIGGFLLRTAIVFVGEARWR